MKWLGRSLIALTFVAVLIVGINQFGYGSSPKNVDNDTPVEDLEMPDICDDCADDDEEV